MNSPKNVRVKRKQISMVNKKLTRKGECSSYRGFELSANYVYVMLTTFFGNTNRIREGDMFGVPMLECPEVHCILKYN